MYLSVFPSLITPCPIRALIMDKKCTASGRMHRHQQRELIGWRQERERWREGGENINPADGFVSVHRGLILLYCAMFCLYSR